MPKRKVLFQQIYHQIRDAILNHEYSSGEMLPSEHQLCDRYSTSRFTIRSALKLLAQENLVETLPGRGWQVLDPKRERSVTTNATLLFIGRSGESSVKIYDGLVDGLTSREEIVQFVPYHQVIENYSKLPNEAFNDETVKGLFVFTDHTIPESFAQWANRKHIPIIGIALNKHTVYDTVCADFFDGSGRIIQHVLQQGHRSIAFVGNKELHHSNRSFRARLDGYEVAMKHHGLIPQTLLLPGGFYLQPDIDRRFDLWLNDTEKNSEKITCIIFSGSDYGYHCTPILRRLGYVIPEDISLCGFGMSEMTEEMNGIEFSLLTYLSEPWYELGRIGAIRMVSRLNGENAPPTLTMVPMEIHDGDSVYDKSN